MKVAIDTSEVLAAALSRIKPNYTLGYVGQGDRLTDEQIERVFQGEVSEVELEIIDQWDDNDHYYVDQIVNELVPDPVERAVLESSGDDFGELTMAIRERNDACIWNDLVQETGRYGHLMRYHLGNPDDEQDLAYGTAMPADGSSQAIRRHARRLARMAGVDYTANASAFDQMVLEQAYYGGRLYVMFYGSVGSLIEATCQAAWQEEKPRRRIITWTNPELVLLDGWNGSGYGESITGTISKVWDPTRCHIDSAGPGYGWDSVASVVKSAYECDFDITVPKQKGKK